MGVFVMRQFVFRMMVVMNISHCFVCFLGITAMLVIVSMGV